MSSIEMCHSSAASSTNKNTNQHSSFDLEGLEESLVDNNEDDDEDEDDNFIMDCARLNDSIGMGNYSPGSSGIIFDHNLYLIREALIRDSASRSEDDIEIIVRFLSIINSNHDHMTRRRLAPHFVLAEIEARDTRVLTHGEKLDAYCIVAAGSLRHVLPCDESLLTLQETSVDDDNYMTTLAINTNNNNNSNNNNNDSDNFLLPQNMNDTNIISASSSSSSSTLQQQQHHHHLHHQHQNTRFLHVGDEFGAHLDDRVVYGEIFTNEDFVWVLCVPHVIFDQICGEKTFKTIRDEVTGNIIEMRANCHLPLPPLPSTTSTVASTSTTTTVNNQVIVGPGSAPDTNSLGSTNLTSSDLSLSQQSENNKSSQMILNFDQSSTNDDYVTEISITPKSVSLTSMPPNSLPIHHASTNATINTSSNNKPTSSTNATAVTTINTAAGVSDTTGNELIRATKERLYELLLNSEPNETFIEDFLLTFRIWSEKDLNSSKDSKIMADLMSRICSNIRGSNHVENCVRIVLIWLVNHYQDFQNENRYLLDEFEQALKENSQHKSQLRLFYMHLSAKSLERQVTVTRSDRNSPLIFSLIGGYECSARLFIGEILNNSPQQQQSNPVANLDLRPGDRVISINGVDCHVMPIGRAYELCRSSTHLSLQVKYDPHLFYALIEGRHETKRQIVETFPLTTTNRLSTSTSTSSGFGGSSSTSSSSSLSSSINNNNNNSNINSNVQTSSTIKDHHHHKKEKSEGGGGGSGNIWKQKVRSFVSTTTNQLKSSTSSILNNSSNNSSNNNNNSNQSINQNNNLTNNNSNSSSGTLSSSNNNNINNNAAQTSSHPRILSYEVPEIIKIYSFEHNDCCFLPIHSSTTVRECIQLALRQFKYSNNFSSRDFALYEYSVIFQNNPSSTSASANTSGSSGNVAGDENCQSSTVVKRLSDGTNDLVNNLGLNSRLYLKLVTQTKDSNNSGDTLSDSDIAKEIIKDSSVNSLLTLQGYAIARELTARDFRLFCKIEAQQFVYDLAFNDPNNSQQNPIVCERTRELQEFERKTNEEMFWTINQVLGEKRSITKRVKAIKQLIRIATLAMKLNNYNTLFAIISGLMHLSVSRLKSCWDKVPAKHVKQLQKLQQLMDPSRNFYNFRQQLMQKLREDNGASIIIPFFPLVKKDLSFIWLANQTYVNSAEPQTPSSSSTSGESAASGSVSGGKSQNNNNTEMLVNWEKMRLLSEKIREIQKMANTTSLALAAVNGLNQGSNGSKLANSSIANEPIDPNLLFRIFADASSLEHKSTNDHKKLWENQRMTKRVQSFLDETFTSISSDEHELMSRSYSCELPQTPNSSHVTGTTRSSIASTMSSNSQLSHPSPTPSSASSSSNSLSMNSDGTPGGPVLYRPHRPKFGQTSPKQLRKLLALSDGAVIVPHSGNTGSNVSGGNQGGGNHHHHHHGGPNNASHHSHHHHHHQYNTNSIGIAGGSGSRMSTASNYPPSGIQISGNNGGNNSSSGYYPNNSMYPPSNQYPPPPTMMSNSGSSSSLYGNGNLLNTSNHHHSQTHPHHPHHNYMPNSKVGSGPGSYSNTSSSHIMSATTPSGYNPSGLSCCSMIGSQMCCTASGTLYPNQSYCSCCNSMMRPSMLMMPPPQTSGLMHPGCSCTSSSIRSSTSGRRQNSNSLPPKQSLPVESSSVTSLRRLDQFQHMARHRDLRHHSGNSSKQSANQNNQRQRPQCPDYDTTMQRICGGSSVSINGNLIQQNNPNSGNTLGSSTSGGGKHRSNHHREDIV